MTTKYFILTKDAASNIDDDTNNQIFYTNSSQAYILPRVNLDYYASNGLFENHLINWASQFCSRDKVFLDIGAHTGTYTIALASKCKQVYSFEPQKMTYYALCGSIALSNLNNVICIQSGLGSIEQVGKITLNIVSDDGGGSTVHAPENTTVLRTEDIQIKTLDSFNLNNIGFIKMDVEDNELFVLKGAVKTLHMSNYPKILFEMNKYNNELVNYLTQSLKYRIVGVGGYSNMYLAEI